jgi:hypothetical protein
VTVSVELPAGVLDVVCTVSVVLPPEAGLGEKEAVAPAGRPVTLKPTGSACPPERAMLIV